MFNKKKCSIITLSFQAIIRLQTKYLHFYVNIDDEAIFRLKTKYLYLCVNIDDEEMVRLQTKIVIFIWKPCVLRDSALVLWISPITCVHSITKYGIGAHSESWRGYVVNDASR